jgi:hypothetical protein
MELNKFEKQFKEQLNFREIKPSKMAWDKLDSMLTDANEKPKRNFRWFYVAASIFGFLLVGTSYFSRFETVVINNDKSIVLEQKGDIRNFGGLKIIKKGVFRGQMPKKVTMTQTVVACSYGTKIKLNRLKNKVELPIFIHLKEDTVTLNSSESKNYQSTNTNKYISAEKLLAEVSEVKFEIKDTDAPNKKKRKAISVKPNDLLLNAETELNQSFRESALDRFNKKFNTVKTVFVNRNYEK